MVQPTINIPLTHTDPQIMRIISHCTSKSTQTLSQRGFPWFLGCAPKLKSSNILLDFSQSSSYGDSPSHRALRPGLGPLLFKASLVSWRTPCHRAISWWSDGVQKTLAICFNAFLGKKTPDFPVSGGGLDGMWHMWHMTSAHLLAWWYTSAGPAAWSQKLGSGWNITHLLIVSHWNGSFSRRYIGLDCKTLQIICTQRVVYTCSYVFVHVFSWVFRCGDQGF